MLEPLTRGPHVVNFGGTQGSSPPTFALDVTYNINVVGASAIPLPAGVWLGMPGLALAGLVIRRARHRFVAR